MLRVPIQIKTRHRRAARHFVSLLGSGVDMGAVCSSHDPLGGELIFKFNMWDPISPKLQEETNPVVALTLTGLLNVALPLGQEVVETVTPAQMRTHRSCTACFVGRFLFNVFTLWQVENYRLSWCGCKGMHLLDALLTTSH